MVSINIAEDRTVTKIGQVMCSSLSTNCCIDNMDRLCRFYCIDPAMRKTPKYSAYKGSSTRYFCNFKFNRTPLNRNQSLALKSTMDLIEEILSKKESASLHVRTLGMFQVTIDNQVIPSKNWGREKTVQLFQYLVSARHRQGLHKEQIIDRIWEDSGPKEGNRDFKVALHGINKAIEPDRPKRTEPKYVHRQGLTYRLNFDQIWIDVDAFDSLVSIGNELITKQPDQTKIAFKEAIKLYKGIYLPNRVYEDWASMERERLQVLALGIFISLGELMLEDNPLESIRLSQQALIIDPTWEDAYRLQMAAYHKKGNRPNAIKAYQKCAKILEKEYGIEPLPVTKALLDQIKAT